MKTHLLLWLSLLMAVQAFGQPILRQATDAEVAAGTDVHAFLNPRQGQGIGGTTNGQTALQVAAAIGNSSILQTNGSGTNTSLGSPTFLSGSYKTIYLSDGSVLETNSAVPFDWRYRGTNGLYKWGSNTVTKVQINTLTGGFTASSAAIGGVAIQISSNGITGNAVNVTAVTGTAVNATTLTGASGAFGVNSAGVITNLYYIAEAGKTNIILVQSDGTFSTNDYATWVASLAAGGSQTPWASDINAANHSLTYLAHLKMTNSVNTGFMDFLLLQSTYGVGLGLTSASTNNTTASSFMQFDRFVANLGFVGDGSSITNIKNGNTITAGANLTSTPSLNANGSTNFALAVADPMNLGQANIGAAWITNAVTPTNAFAGTVVDFSLAESRTNLGGNLTFTGVANVTLGALNSCIITMAANGADRTIGFPASFHANRNATLVITNGTEANFLFRLQPGVRTNVYQVDTL